MSEIKSKHRARIAFSGVAALSLGGLLFLFQNCGKYAPVGKTSPMESLSSSSQNNSQGTGGTGGIGAGATAPPSGTTGGTSTGGAAGGAGASSTGTMGGGATSAGSTTSGTTNSGTTNSSTTTGGTTGAGTTTSTTPSATKCQFNGEGFAQGVLHTFYQVNQSSTYCKDSEVYYQCVLSANGTPVWRYVSHRGGLRDSEIATKFKSCTTQGDYGKCSVTAAASAVSFTAESEPSSANIGKAGYYFFYGYRPANGDFYGYTPSGWLNAENFPLQVMNSIPFFIGGGDGVSRWHRYIGNDAGVSAAEAEASAYSLMGGGKIDRNYLQLNFSIPSAEAYPSYQGVQIRYGYGLGSSKVEAFNEMERSRRFIGCGTL